MVMTVMSVATPMVRPRTVSVARSLWTRIEAIAIARSSLNAAMFSERSRDGYTPPLLADLNGMHRSGAERKIHLRLLHTVDDYCSRFALPGGVAHRVRQADSRHQLIDVDCARRPQILRKRHCLDVGGNLTLADNARELLLSGARVRLGMEIADDPLGQLDLCFHRMGLAGADPGLQLPDLRKAQVGQQLVVVEHQIVGDLHH